MPVKTKTALVIQVSVIMVCHNCNKNVISLSGYVVFDREEIDAAKISGLFCNDCGEAFEVPKIKSFS